MKDFSGELSYLIKTGSCLAEKLLVVLFEWEYCINWADAFIQVSQDSFCLGSNSSWPFVG